MVSSVQCSVQFLRLGVTAAKAFNLNLRLIHLPLGFCSANTNKLASDLRQTYLLSMYLQFYIILHSLNVQVPCGVRAGGALHLPRHPQHPPVLRHETRRAEAAPADHQQDKQQ